MDSPPFDQAHCPEVFLFPGFVRQPGVPSCHFNTGVAKQGLQTLEPHSRIQEFARECMPKAMKRIAFVKESGFLQVFDKHCPRAGIGEA
jgi:hypothetical protein